MSEGKKVIVISSEWLTEAAERAVALEERDEKEPYVRLSQATADLLKRVHGIAPTRTTDDELIRRALEAYLQKSE